MAQKWGKLSRTAALCGAYISLVNIYCIKSQQMFSINYCFKKGICFSVTGPTLLYLKDQVGATLSEISYIFTLRSVGTLGGAFLGNLSLLAINSSRLIKNSFFLRWLSS